MTKSALFFLIFLGAHTFLSAQRTVSGVVSDKNTGEPLIGATVVVKGEPSKGTTTDFDGKFSLRVSQATETLLISYTGFETVEQSIKGINEVTVQMVDGKLLQDVLVIGYGTVKREDATGLVQSVSAEKFNKGAITGPQELLAGKVAGVVVTTGSGAPGEGATIRIRGESSISGSKDPLIVVDGIPLENGNVNGNRNQLNLINPNDIETFTVLKDASAAAIYGNRASAGVILITTKKGALGKKIKVGYSANVSAGQNTRLIDVLTADEFRAAINNHYTDPVLTQAHALVSDGSTDWQKEIFQTAIGTDHNLYVSGGVWKVPYRVSVGFTDKDGVLKTDNFKRYTAGVNLNPGFLKNTLQLNLNFKGMHTQNQFADRGAIGSALSYDPTKPVRDTSTAYGGFYTWKLVNGNPNGLAPTNPVALLELRDDHSTVNQMILNASADYRLPFLPALRANLSVGMDRSNGSGNTIVPNFASFSFDQIYGGGTNNAYDATRTNRVLETYLNYKETFGIHSIDLMGGYSWQQFREESSYLNSNTAGSPEKTTQGYDGSEYFLISQYARLNYGLNDRYLLTGSIRRDGTSRFGEAHRWGYFPAAALAVKLLNNGNKMFNFAKLRLSVGVTGQQELGGRYPHLAVYQSSLPGASYQFGNEFLPTIRPNGYNANLKWEETTTYNAGLDFNIIKDRVSGTLDIYQRNTKDLLVYVALPALSNLSNFGDINIGTMETKGVELSLNFTPITNRNFNWDLGTNLSYNDYKITKLNQNPDPGYAGILTGGIAGGVGSNIQVHTVGYAPNSFYVYEQEYDENGNIREGVYKDRNNDGLVNDLDKYRYQRPAPRYTFGLTNSMKYRQLGFTFAGRANVGNYIYNNVQTDMGYLDRLYQSSGYLNNVNQSAVDLKIKSQANATFSDHFVTDASFFRLDHVTLDYTFPKLIGESFTISGTIQNPFVITKYDGVDPEIFGGIDNSFYPRPRTYVFGLSVQF